MAKFVTVEEVAAMIKDGMTLMIGGFLACGTPSRIVDAIVNQELKTSRLWVMTQVILTEA